MGETVVEVDCRAFGRNGDFEFRVTLGNRTFLLPKLGSPDKPLDRELREGVNTNPKLSSATKSMNLLPPDLPDAVFTRLPPAAVEAL